MKNHVLIKVFAAIFLAVIAGLLSGPDKEIFGVTFLQIYSLIGQLFLNALTLVVVPLVASSIIIGAARMGSEGSFGTLGLKTFGYFMLTTFLAVAVGMIVVLIIEPGIAQKTLEMAHTSQTSHLTEIEKLGQGGTFQKVEQLLLKLIPSNILAVASQGQMLGLIFFSLLFGYFISQIDSAAGQVMLGFWNAVFQIMMKITHLVMRALPIGVFGLVAKVVATTGAEAFLAVAWFTLTVVIGLLIYACIVLPLLLRFVAKVSPLAHFWAMGPALLTAFSTSSSAATLPLTLECLEKRANVSNRICSFTVPLGTSLNLTASALFICVTVLFIAQAYGIPMSAGFLINVFLLVVFSSIGLAGIPSACLIGAVLVLHSLGLPVDAIGLVLAVERILDMLRTVVNVFGTSCCAVLVAKSEGETNVLTPTPQVM
jgi:proton glutamate symport protein